MTNVPQELRDMWADLYRLFDINYLMPNTPEAWNKFWEQAMQLKIKHKDPPHFIEIVITISDMISDRMRDEMIHEHEHPCTLEDMTLF